MDNLTVFAERLRECMDDANLTQDELTRIAGCGRGSISRWLNAKSFPYEKNLIRLSEYFGCSIDFLLGREDLSQRNDFELVSSFPQRLKVLASEKQKTLHGVATNLKTDDATLYNWSNGKYIPSVPNLIMLADYFGCSVDYLLGRQE